MALMSGRSRRDELLPRFLNGVSAMALSAEKSLAGRLAFAVDQVAVFTVEDFPSELRPKYAELMRLFDSARVPSVAKNHPLWQRRVPVYYLHWTKARRAAELLVELFEALVRARPSPEEHA